MKNDAPDLTFDVERFAYDKQPDHYTCPAGETLTTNGRWYFKNHGKTVNRVKHYKTKPVRIAGSLNAASKTKWAFLPR